MAPNSQTLCNIDSIIAAQKKAFILNGQSQIMCSVTASAIYIKIIIYIFVHKRM